MWAILFVILIGIGIIFAMIKSFQKTKKSIEPAKDNEVKKTLHEEYPDIMFWKAGDDLIFKNAKIFKGSLYFYSGYTQESIKATLVSVHPSGKLYFDVGVVCEVPFDYAYPYMKNLSAEERKRKQHLKESKDYMKLFSDFQKAVKKLEDNNTPML